MLTLLVIVGYEGHVHESKAPHKADKTQEVTQSTGSHPAVGGRCLQIFHVRTSRHLKNDIEFC